ncbi:MAG: hypothetical protein WBW48_03710 [Anaerolineae bacterium]
MPNLDQVAYEYLTVGTNYQAPLKETLVRAGLASIVALLRAGIRSADEIGKKHIKPTFGLPAPEFMLSLVIGAMWWPGERMTKAIHAVAAEFGQPAMDELCRTLQQRDQKTAVLASLVLLVQKNHTYRTIMQVEGGFNFLRNNINLSERELHRRGCLLGQILAQAGVEEEIQRWNRVAKREGRGVEEIFEDNLKEAWLYLCGVEAPI